MKSLMLVSRHDDNVGHVGLMLRGLSVADGDSFVATDGLLIAHDVIEHQNGVAAIGTIDDELEALGAIWYVRGQFNDLRRDGIVSRWSPEENVSADVVRMFRDHCEGEAHIGATPRTRACEADDAFVRILECAARAWPAEFSIPGEGREAWPTYRALCMARMRIGYRKAAKRFGNAHDANRQFWAIADAVQPIAWRCYSDDVAGMEFRLTFGNGEARCEARYEY